MRDRTVWGAGPVKSTSTAASDSGSGDAGGATVRLPMAKAKTRARPRFTPLLRSVVTVRPSLCAVRPDRSNPRPPDARMPWFGEISAQRGWFADGVHIGAPLTLHTGRRVRARGNPLQG